MKREIGVILIVSTLLFFQVGMSFLKSDYVTFSEVMSELSIFVNISSECVGDNKNSVKGVNVKEFGCVYDGVTDDSEKIMMIKQNKLYFPEGVISLKREAVQFLFTKDVYGEGKIIINDFFKMSPTKYDGNGEIYISDFYNDYIASMNLPNEGIPNTDFGHQNRNGWINPYTVLAKEYSTEYIVCWGQIYPISEKMLSNEAEEITICLSGVDIQYFDYISEKWIMSKKSVLPKLYGFYDKNYKSVENGGVEFIPIKEAKVIECDGYVEVTFPRAFIKDRVLHFGIDDKDIPVENELYLIGEYNVWVKNKEHANEFVANVGIDLYLPKTFEKRIREYCGSRYITIMEKPKRVCLAYVEGNYEILRGISK